MSGKHLALQKVHIGKRIQQIIIVLHDQMRMRCSLHSGVKLTRPYEKNIAVL